MFSLSSIQGRLLVAVSAGVVLFMIISGIAIALLSNTIANYNQLIANSVAHERAISSMNYHFKTQVQEWKNVLLRGKNPDKLQQYWGQFETLQRSIQAEGKALSIELSGTSREQPMKLPLAAIKQAWMRLKRRILIQPRAMQPSPVSTGNPASCWRNQPR